MKEPDFSPATRADVQLVDHLAWSNAKSIGDLRRSTHRAFVLLTIAAVMSVVSLLLSVVAILLKLS